MANPPDPGVTWRIDVSEVVILPGGARGLTRSVQVREVAFVHEAPGGKRRPGTRGRWQNTTCASRVKLMALVAIRLVVSVACKRFLSFRRKRRLSLEEVNRWMELVASLTSRCAIYGTMVVGLG